MAREPGNLKWRRSGPNSARTDTHTPSRCIQGACWGEQQLPHLISVVPRQHCGQPQSLPWAAAPLTCQEQQPSRSQELREREKGMWVGKGTALWGAGGGLRSSKKDLTDHFLLHYFRIIVISCKHSFPTQLLTVMVLVWCWPPAMLINGFRIIFIHFAHFTHSTSCDLCSPCSSYFYLNCRASSEF